VTRRCETSRGLCDLVLIGITTYGSSGTGCIYWACHIQQCFTPTSSIHWASNNNFDKPTLTDPLIATSTRVVSRHPLKLSCSAPLPQPRHVSNVILLRVVRSGRGPLDSLELTRASLERSAWKQCKQVERLAGQILNTLIDRFARPRSV